MRVLGGEAEKDFISIIVIVFCLFLRFDVVRKLMLSYLSYIYLVFIGDYDI